MDAVSKGRCHVCGKAAARLREVFYMRGNPVPVLYCEKCGKGRAVVGWWAYAVMRCWRRFLAGGKRG